MAITVNTNVTSMKSQVNLNRSSNALSMSMERLSSGLRINSAKDDAAGLAISNRLSSQVNGLDVGMRNANDVISVAQIAEGALGKQTNMLQRMRDLTVQATNGANSATDVASLQAELDKLAQGITDISNNTAFGSQKLLDGNYTGKIFQTGFQAAENVSVTITKSDAATLAVDALALTSSGNTASLSAIDAALQTVDAQRANLGATQNAVAFGIDNNANIQANVADARSRIVDVDFAKESSEMTKQQVLQQSGAAMLAQANQLPQIALTLVR